MVEDLSTRLQRVLDTFVRPGDVIGSFHGPFGSVNVQAGNGRGARRFEVAGKARMGAIHVNYPELMKFLVPAWPLNDQGVRMSGRAGNSRVRGDDTVTLQVELCQGAWSDNKTGNDALMETVAKAVERGAL